jgi:hypothetical protein
VAITRGKYCSILVLNGQTMSAKSAVWKALITDAKERGCYIDATTITAFSNVINEQRIMVSPISFDCAFFARTEAIDCLDPSNAGASPQAPSAVG